MALSDRDRRAVTILGGVAGLALVAFLLMKVLGGGGGEEAEPALSAGGAVTQPSPSATPKTPRETLPPVALADTRDPFSPPPIFASPSGGVGPTSSSSPSGTQTSGTGSSGTGSSGTGSSGTRSTSTQTTPGGGASATFGSHTVVLVDIFDGGTRAQIEVDGKVYTVDEGKEFAGSFRADSIGASCVDVSRGGKSATICVNPQK